MTENWRPVVGYEGEYEVSDLGRIRSLLWDDGPRVLSARRHTKYGHLAVDLKGKAKSVHRAVYEAFVGEIPGNEVIRHLDGNPANNALSNLKTGSRSENFHDCYAYGGRHGHGKLHREDVQRIRQLLAQNVPQVEIAKRFGVNRGTISKIKTGRTFSYI